MRLQRAEAVGGTVKFHCIRCVRMPEFLEGSCHAAGFIQVENVHLHSMLSRSQLQDATRGLPLEVVELSVRTLRFKLPDLSRWTLEIAVDGFSVSCKQKNMPPVRHFPAGGCRMSQAWLVGGCIDRVRICARSMVPWRRHRE